MKFFDDPSELDHHIIPIIFESIDAGAWDLVLQEIEKHIAVMKAEVHRLDKKHPDHGYWLLQECESISDVSHARGLIRGDKGEAFRQCLSALFGVRDAIMEYQPFDDGIKADFRADVKEYQQHVKEIMLMDATPQVWQKNTSLAAGRAESKGLDALRILIYTILEKHGPISVRDLLKKLKVYRDDNPFQWKDFELKYDPDDQKFYQVDGQGRERSTGEKQVYEYRNHALKYLKKTHLPIK